MEIKKSTPLFVTGALLVSSLGATLYAQGPQSNKTPAAAMPQMCMMQGDMAGHGKMMANMKAGDAKLDSLVTKMNAAKGFDKVNAMAAVTSEMVTQRKTMHAQMQTMHQQMMGGGMKGQGMKGQDMKGQGMKGQDMKGQDMKGQGMKGQGMGNQTAMHDKMMAHMKADDAKLDSLVAKMNAAKGFDKVNAMATLTKEMISQRKTMHTQMQTMHQQMMGGGMMGKGMTGQGMMGKPDAKPDTKPDEHAQHH